MNTLPVQDRALTAVRASMVTSTSRGVRRVGAMAGGGAGRFKGGRHIRYPKGTPMTNLFMTMLDGVGVKPEKIGDSTGYVSGL